MGDKSKIEWTNATWNPVTGCTKVSPGCDHCYAERITERFSGPGSFAKVVLHEDRLDLPLRWRKARRVFVNSMSDLFHDDVPDLFLTRVFDVMEQATEHTFQVLTKRHARMRSFMRDRQKRREDYARAFEESPIPERRTCPAARDARRRADRPPANIWLGVSVEDQKWADIRVPALVDTPAAVRFLSCEPLLGRVDLTPWVSGNWCPDRQCADSTWDHECRLGERPLGWVICGGESGRNARPMHPDWARQLRDQCVAAGVPFFFKQFGEWAPTGALGIGGHDPRRGFVGAPKDEHGCREEIARVGKHKAGRVLDGRTWDEYPQAGAA
jgi:protein gp37